MKTVENAIISTDLAMYFKKKDSFNELVDGGEFDWQSEGKKERELHCSDVNFYLQGNCEIIHRL
jgi:hypothetical protein